MILHRKEIERIQGVLNKFPNVETFELTYENSSGIGAVVTMIFNQEVNDMRGNFEIEISGVEDW